MKDKIRVISLIAVFIILVFSITITRLLIKYDESGSFNTNKEFYDIRLSNARINFDTKSTIKINNEDKSIYFELSNLNDFITEKTFYIDLSNLGNKDVIVTNMYYSNINTNIKSDDVDIFVNIKNTDKILGGENKKLVVKVKYNGKKTNDESYYNFNINYNFEKVSL